MVFPSRLTGPLIAIGAALAWQPVSADLTGYIGVQARGFTESPAYSGQDNKPVVSLVSEPEFYRAWNDGQDSVLFKSFIRLDSADAERTHADIRELFWLRAGDGWEFGAGIGKVFWGVTESLHLVDIVNQTDLVESPDGEDKLGQPMLRYTAIKDWGVVDFFVLPGFRPRTFPGEEGRLRGELVVDYDDETYESSAEEKHVDYAIRWSHYIGQWDFGVSWFQGTSREPLFLPKGNARLTPYYPQIGQFGLTSQYISGEWLWKFEGIHRQWDEDDYSAFTGGFEYTRVGIFDSWYDLGWLMEYSWDEQDELSSTGFQNDLFAGGRFAFNDEASSEILFGVIQDLDYSGSRAAFVEASTRVGQGSKIYLEARLFDSDDPKDASLYPVRKDSYLELTFEYYF